MKANLNKERIIERLRTYSSINRASLPRDIDFVIKNGILEVLVKNVTSNMQSDAAAFESWIVILKYWLDEEVESVVLNFNIPKEITGLLGKPKECHYNRFLYRVWNMKRFFPTWFFIHQSKFEIVNSFWIKINEGNYLINHSLKERTSVINSQHMERQIESWFVFEEGKELLCDFYNLNRNKVFNQLPIGIFQDEINSKNAVFTRGASAIDIWGIGTSENQIHIIELKCGKNRGLGVISEVLFQAAIIFDLCVSPNRFFDFGTYNNTQVTSDKKALMNNGKKFTELHVHLLAEKYHSLINPGVVDLIKSSLIKHNMVFDIAFYSYKKKEIYCG